MERKIARCRAYFALGAARDKSFLVFIISAGDAHQFCLMQRKAILISGHSGIVIPCTRFENGGSNGLEGSKDCRSVGGHGNQHVRLRSAQVSLSGTTCPVQEPIFAFEPRQAPEGPICKRKIFRTSRRGSRRCLSCQSGRVLLLLKIPDQESNGYSGAFRPRSRHHVME